MESLFHSDWGGEGKRRRKLLWLPQFPLNAHRATTSTYKRRGLIEWVLEGGRECVSTLGEWMEESNCSVMHYSLRGMEGISRVRYFCGLFAYFLPLLENENFIEDAKLRYCARKKFAKFGNEEWQARTYKLNSDPASSKPKVAKAPVPKILMRRGPKRNPWRASISTNTHAIHRGNEKLHSCGGETRREKGDLWRDIFGKRKRKERGEGSH